MLDLSSVYMGICDMILIISYSLEIFHDLKNNIYRYQIVTWEKIQYQHFQWVSNFKILKEKWLIQLKLPKSKQRHSIL